MREIKFRSWDNDKMIDVKILEYVPEHKSFSGKAGYNINYHLGIPAENLMQYTGLKDKNGKEIYEGDIVVIRDCDGFEIGRCKVVFNNGGFVVSADFGEYDSTTVGWAMEMDNEIEVIGNIYENPELLEKP